MKKKVIIAMSGGVDSSVAAALLKEQGFEVIGITMNLFSLPKEFCRSENLTSCCGWRAAEEANSVAVRLGISHYVVDFKKDFEKEVISDFCREYNLGRTPNPCLRCNQYIKFDLLLRKMKTLDADYIATGHHARIGYDPQSGRYLLKKGRDRHKDQSYFLYTLTQKQLAMTLMPVGELTKVQVRDKARELNLSVADKPESQEICFIPDNDYPGFLKNRIPEAFKPGPIVDTDNKKIGQHHGIGHFTIGQRRGIGISAKQPLYVLAINHKINSIMVGSNSSLDKKKLVAARVNFISVDKINKPIEVNAKIRYKHKEARSVIKPKNTDQVLVEFKKSQRAVTPGQAVVFYKGNVVVGGGTIESEKS